MIIQIFTLVITLAIIFRINLKIGILISFMLPTTIVMLKIFNPVIKNFHTKALDKYSFMNSVLQENIYNSKGILYLRIFKYPQDRFESSLKEYRGLSSNSFSWICFSQT